MSDPWGAGKAPTFWTRRRIAASLAILALAAIAVYFLLRGFPGALEGEFRVQRLIYLVMLLILIAGGFFASRRLNLARALKQLAVWFTIAALLAVAYSFRSEFKLLRDRVMGDLVPGQGYAGSEYAISFRPGRNGHFVVDGLVDGRPVRFLVDTGASLVVLSPDDAARLGFDLDDLVFNRVMNTANGQVLGASVRIARLTIGRIVVADVPAIVNGAPLKQSLLGMSFLERLQSFEFKPDELTLRGKAAD